MVVSPAFPNNWDILMSGSAVMGLQCEQEGAEHMSLGDSVVEH